MRNWTEFRTAYWVAELGTVSAASRQLDLHRATIIRHVDLIEEELGVKLFIRSATGYSPTSAGEELLRVGGATIDQFEDLVGRLRKDNSSLTGDVVVTSIQIISPLVTSLLPQFMSEHPHINVRYLASDRLFKLQYGEAHVAVRTGKKPTFPDAIVRHWQTLKSGLYAHPSYVERVGFPTDLNAHVCIGPMARNPIHDWFVDLGVPTCAFTSPNEDVRLDAIRSGLGLGFCPEFIAKREGFIEVIAPKDEWSIELWLMAHVDLSKLPRFKQFGKHCGTES